MTALLETAFRLAFEISPIILVDGIAGSIPGNMLPIVVFTEAANFTLGLLGGASVFNLDNFFAHFKPMPGATLISNDIGKYPFANQAVAANAVIAKPLNVSLQMICPARGSLGYAAKLATMIAVKATLQQHISLGGTFTVLTPSFIYTNCLLTNMRHLSDAESKQAQVIWGLDFEQPLLTEAQAALSFNSLISRITGGVKTDTAWSGLGQSVGFSPSLASPALIPAAQAAGGSINSTNLQATP